MCQIFFILLATTGALLSFVGAQQEPIYVPFEWSGAPLTATTIGISGATTTYGIIDGRTRLRSATPGPATLIQGPSAASMIYAAPTTTLSGICNLQSPVAMCTLNVQEKGAPLPSTGLAGRASGRASTSTGRTSGTGSLAFPTMGGWMLALGTVILGSFISIALLR